MLIFLPTLVVVRLTFYVVKQLLAKEDREITLTKASGQTIAERSVQFSFAS